MKIEIKILNKEFYKRTDEQMLSYPPKDIYDLPFYATPGSAGMDLVCTEDVTIYPGETKMIPTGIAIWIGSREPWPVMEYERFEASKGYSSIYQPLRMAGLIVPRSGLGTKGLILANTIGVIDEDYQGELKISAWNRNKDYKGNAAEQLYCRDVNLKAGDRVAQLLFVPIFKPQWEIVDEFSKSTVRKEGGFGSTGD